MKVRVFTLKVDESGRFDDLELVEFFAGHQALSVTEHFFINDDQPTLALVVRYREALPAREARGQKPSRNKRGELEILPEERGAFEALRKWRNERARQEGKPAYVLFTNEQLLRIVRDRPQTKQALAEIDGIGAARIKNYAIELLATLEAVPPMSTASACEKIDEQISPVGP